jgi:hypothetical protein
MGRAFRHLSIASELSKLNFYAAPEFAPVPLLTQGLRVCVRRLSVVNAGLAHFPLPTPGLTSRAAMFSSFGADFVVFHLPARKYGWHSYNQSNRSQEHRFLHRLYAYPLVTSGSRLLRDRAASCAARTHGPKPSPEPNRAARYDSGDGLSIRITV